MNSRRYLRYTLASWAWSPLSSFFNICLVLADFIINARDAQKVTQVVQNSFKEEEKGAKTLSLKLGSFGITLNNVLPGSTRTGRLTSLIRTWANEKGITEEELEQKDRSKIPLQRLAGPSEVASVAAFLATHQPPHTSQE